MLTEEQIKSFGDFLSWARSELEHLRDDLGIEDEYTWETLAHAEGVFEVLKTSFSGAGNPANQIGEENL